MVILTPQRYQNHAVIILSNIINNIKIILPQYSRLIPGYRNTTVIPYSNNSIHTREIRCDIISRRTLWHYSIPAPITLPCRLFLPHDSHTTKHSFTQFLHCRQSRPRPVVHRTSSPAPSDRRGAHLNSRVLPTTVRTDTSRQTPLTVTLSTTCGVAHTFGPLAHTPPPGLLS